MNLSGIEKVKGFMPKHEGCALLNWAEKFSEIGPWGAKVSASYFGPSPRSR